MNLRDLEYLVALDEHRHFGQAAAACFVSQPTLSTQVKKLEHELGVELVERGQRQVMLTAAGDEVAARARIILGQAQDIRGIAKRAKNPRSGTLTLGVFPTLAPYLLPYVVPKLHEQYPDLRLRLVEEKSGDLLEGLRAGRIDAAILALPVGDDGLAGERLFREDFVLALPSSHPLAADHSPLPSAALADEHLLLLEDGHCMRDQALAVCQLAGATEDSSFRASSLETLRHMVASGNGMTLLPRLAVTPPVMSPAGLVLRELEAPAPHRDLGLFWRRASTFGPLLPEIAACLRDLPAGLVTPLEPNPA